MSTTNNLALGLGVAVLGFALYRTLRPATAGAPQPALALPGMVSGGSSGGGSLWQGLTFPLGSTGSSPGSVNGVYTSTSWNPDAISAALAADTVAAMGASGQSMSNSYGFHL
jgi:hypothetical protein